jgi:hypothetical protein
MNSKSATYDSAGRTGLGAHEFEKFENIPEDYLGWVFDNIEHGKLQTQYPNLWKYLKELGY